MGASLYEDRLSGTISLDTYQMLSITAETELLEKKAAQERLVEVVQKAERVANDVSAWITALRDFLSLEQPDRNLLYSLIRRIEVGEGEGRGKSRRQCIRVIYRVTSCGGNRTAREVRYETE